MTVEYEDAITEVTGQVLRDLDEGDFVSFRNQGVSYAGPLALNGNGSLYLGTLNFKMKGHDYPNYGTKEDVEYVLKLKYPEWAKNPPRVLEVAADGLTSEIYASRGKATHNYFLPNSTKAVSLRKLIGMGAVPYRSAAERNSVDHRVNLKALKYNKIAALIEDAESIQPTHQLTSASADASHLTLGCGFQETYNQIRNIIDR